jgi:hypothetical protein
MTRRERREAARVAASQPVALPVVTVEVTPTLAELEAELIGESEPISEVALPPVEEPASALPVEPEQPETQPRIVASTGLVRCRVWPYGALHHDGQQYAPGTELDIPAGVIADVGGALIRIE